MKILEKIPEPGDWVLCGKHPSRTYIARCIRVQDGYVMTDKQDAYPHDVQNVFVMEE